MKQSPLSTFFSKMVLLPLFFFLFNSRNKAGLFLILIIMFSTGCYLNFYKTNTLNHLDQMTMTSLKAQEKYYIIHLNDGIYSLNNISVNKDTIDGDILPLSNDHSKYLHPQPYTSPMYKKKHEQLLQEVHLYAISEKHDINNHISFSANQVTRVDIYEKNKARTTTNHILSTVGMVTGGIFLALGIALASATHSTNTGCNCPQVYTYENGNYNFKSGVFSGAVYSSLERTDFLPLGDIKDNNGFYKLRLMNNQLEEQFVNNINLIKVDHDPATNILLDRYGKVYEYKNLIPPLSTSIKQNNSENILEFRDGKSYMFDEKPDRSSAFTGIILTFNKPVNLKHANLVINGKNSMWAGYIYDEFSSLFGNKFQEYTTLQDKATPHKLEAWQKDQAIPMMAYIETNSGWVPIDYFPLTGNTAGRDMIMPVTLPEDNKSTFKIKLETAYMFWELDYAGIDFYNDTKQNAETINISTAIKSNSGESEVLNLSDKDHHYTKLLQKEYLDVTFKKPEPAINKISSFFLSTTGYYHSLKEYTGSMAKLKLNHFKKKGTFNEFSEYQYIETQKLLAKSEMNTKHSGN